MKYRRRAIEADAVQWTAHNLDEVRTIFPDAYAIDSGWTLAIPLATFRDLVAHVGYYVVRINGLCVPMTATDFEANFEAIQDSSDTEDMGPIALCFDERCKGVLDLTIMQNSAWPHLTKCTKCGQTQSISSMTNWSDRPASHSDVDADATADVPTIATDLIAGLSLDDILTSYQDASSALHALWGDSVSTPDYDKAKWRRLSNALDRMARSAATRAGLPPTESLVTTK